MYRYSSKRMKQLILLITVLIHFSFSTAQGNVRYRNCNKSKTGRVYFGVKDPKTEKTPFLFLYRKKTTPLFTRKNETATYSFLRNIGIRTNRPLSPWRPSNTNTPSLKAQKNARIHLNIGGGPRLGKVVTGGALNFASEILSPRNPDDELQTEPFLFWSRLFQYQGGTSLSDYFVLRNDSKIRYYDPSLYVQEKIKIFPSLRSRNTLFFVKLKMSIGRKKQSGFH